MDIDFNLDADVALGVLRRLPTEVKNKVAQQAVAAGARVIRDKAKELAPYDGSRSSGVHLRDAIVVAKVKGTNDVYIIGTRSKGKKSAPHAHLQEFGTIHHPPNAFLRPAADLSTQEAAIKMIKKLSAGILKATRRLGR